MKLHSRDRDWPARLFDILTRLGYGFIAREEGLFLDWVDGDSVAAFEARFWIDGQRSMLRVRFTFAQPYSNVATAWLRVRDAGEMDSIMLSVSPQHDRMSGDVRIHADAALPLMRSLSDAYVGWFIELAVHDAWRWHAAAGMHADRAANQDSLRSLAFDDALLDRVGLGEMSGAARARFLEYGQLQLLERIGIRLSEGLTDRQLDDFSALLNGDVEPVLEWLSRNYPDYEDAAEWKFVATSRPGASQSEMAMEVVRLLWLKVNRPDYEDVSRAVFDELEDELRVSRQDILDAARDTG